MKPSSNKKTLSLSVGKRKSYNVIIDGLLAAVTLFFNIRNTISISISIVRTTTKFILNIRNDRIRNSYIIRFKQSILQTINSKTVKLLYTMRQSIKFPLLVTQFEPISFHIRFRQKVISIINGGKLSLSFSPTVATFYTLGAWDTSTLGTMDVKTLGDLDYVVS